MLTNAYSRFKRVKRELGYRLEHGDKIWRTLLLLAALLAVSLVAAITVQLWLQSAPARRELGLQFVLPRIKAVWNPVMDKFNAWPAIYGSLATSVIAIVLAAPFSLAVAIFLAEFVPSSLKTPLNYMVEMLAAIPSVVYGLWGMYVFLPTVVVPIGKFLGRTLGRVPGLSVFFGGTIPASGLSILGAAFILTIMIIPTITAVSRDVLQAIPRSQREAALALGATPWETIYKVLIPYGVSGILGAIILGFGRAIGETMAVTMVIGNSLGGGYSILRPGYTMASIIANEFAEAVSDLHTAALIEIGFILLVITFTLNAIARLLVWNVNRRIMGR